jgi:hypothetical protein
VAFEVVTVEEVERAIPIPFIQGFKVVTAHEYNVAVRIPLTKTSAKIQLRRGLRANLPASAAEGEPLFATDTGEVFVGPSGGGTPRKFAQTEAASGEVTTTDATTTTLCSITLAANTSYVIEAHVAGINTTTPDVGGEHITASVYRLGAGAVIQQQSPLINTLPITWTVNLDTSGNDIRVRVTGNAAATVKWSGSVVIRAKRAY